MPKEQYMCQLCANHSIFNQPKKGHKLKCPFRSCPCSLCALNTKRRALDQIERQLKNDQQPANSRGPEQYQQTKLLPPTIPVKPYFRYAESPPYMVQLPATMTKKELKMLRRDDAIKRPCNSGQKSIFHSAELLATSSSQVQSSH